MKIVFLFLLSLVHLYSQDVTPSVLFDLTTNSVEQLEQKLLSGVVAHKNYYELQLKELNVAVIIHGNAYKFFLKDLNSSPFKSDTKLQKKYETLKIRLQSLASNYDVTFYMCNSGRKAKKINKENLLPFIKLVPSAAITLIDKQNEGFAYIPIN